MPHMKWDESQSLKLAPEIAAGNLRFEYARVAEDVRKAGDPELAARVCVAGVTASPRDVSGRVVLARCYRDMGDADGTIETTQAVLQLDPDNVVALRMLGDLALAANDAQTAAAYYVRVLELDPLNDDMLAFAQGAIPGFDVATYPQAQPEAPIAQPAAPAYRPSVGLADRAQPARTAPEYGARTLDEAPIAAVQPLPVGMGTDRLVIETQSTTIPDGAGAGLPEWSASGGEVSLDEAAAAAATPLVIPPPSFDEQATPPAEPPEIEFAASTMVERTLDDALPHPAPRRRPAAEKPKSPFAPRAAAEAEPAGAGLSMDELLEFRLGAGGIAPGTKPTPAQQKPVERVEPQPPPMAPPPAHVGEPAPPPPAPKPADPSAILAKLRALERQKEVVPDEQIEVQAKRLSYTGSFEGSDVQRVVGTVDSSLDESQIDVGTAAQILPEGTQGLGVEAVSPVGQSGTDSDLQIVGNLPPEAVEAMSLESSLDAALSPSEPSSSAVPAFAAVAQTPEEMVAAGTPTRVLAEMYAMQGHYGKALEVYRALLMRDPADVRIIDRMNEIAKMLAESEGSR